MLPPQRRAAVGAALRRDAVTLRTVDPAAPLDDLRAFDRDVRDARVIGLGEASPGTAEFFQMKQRLLRDLVERHGVTVLAVEDARVVEARAVERYVSTGSGDPADALRHLAWPLQNREMLGLVR
jgi:erythromycin esterase